MVWSSASCAAASLSTASSPHRSPLCSRMRWRFRRTRLLPSLPTSERCTRCSKTTYRETAHIGSTSPCRTQHLTEPISIRCLGYFHLPEVWLGGAPSNEDDLDEAQA